MTQKSERPQRICSERVPLLCRRAVGEGGNGPFEAAEGAVNGQVPETGDRRELIGRG